MNPIEELYEKYLEVTRREEKERAVEELAEELVRQGIAEEYYDLMFDHNDLNATMRWYPSEKYERKIEDIEGFLGAMKRGIITTNEFKERDPEKLMKFIDNVYGCEKAVEFIKRATELGLKITKEDTESGVILIAYKEIMKHNGATAYLGFIKEVIDP